MINRSPHTDLYGIGKGEAQVVDLSSIPRDIAANQERAELMAEKRQARQLERKSDVIGGVSKKLNEKAVFHKDQPYFKELADNIYSYLDKNIDKVLSSDTKTNLELNQMVSDFMAKSEASVNNRKQWEKAGETLMEDIKNFKDKPAFRPEARDYYLNYESFDPKTGEFNPFDFLQLKKNIDLDTYVNKSLFPEASQRAEAMSMDSEVSLDGVTKRYASKTFTPQDAKGLLKREALKPEINEQITYDFQQQPEEVKTSYESPVDWWIEKNVPNLTIGQIKSSVKTDQSSANKPFSYSGGNFSIGNTIGKYDKVGDEEKITFAKSDRTGAENADQTFVLKNNETIKGKPVEWIKTKDNDNWRLRVAYYDNDSQETKTKEIPYNYSASAVQTEYGFNPEQIEAEALKGKSYKKDGVSVTVNKSNGDKVTVEKDGKKYKLPKSQLSQALKQGFKEVK